MSGSRYTAPPPQRQHDSEDEELQAAIRASLQETHHVPQHNNAYPSHNGENDPVFQSAIEESLSREHQERSRSANNQQNFAPPGENFESPPSYTEATSERLYPSIPGGAATPSAPPPYDTPVIPPYPLQNTMPQPEDIRQRRLRRFQH